jgi:DNA-binding CsgD family transcriptional regulator
VSDDPSPEDELIAHEDEGDLATLVEEVASSLTPRRREVLALYGAGYKRPEIAARLGLSDRAVKRDLLEIMDEARAAVARRAGGGCARGEPLVLRFVYGLATSAESTQARLHLSRCRRCEVFCERLDAWRDKAGALLPLPAVEQASPGLLGRLAHRTVDGLASVKQQVFGGGTQPKQQASSTYYRAVDPTPLAAARPGAVAALLVSCVTIGGGAATYCAQHGVDPLSAATGLIAGTEDESPSPSQPSSPPTEAPQYTPAAPSPVAEEPTSAEPEQPSAEVEPQASSNPSPPPEQSFEPASPDYPASESGGEYQAPESAPVEHVRPAAVPAGESPQFGGP